MLVTAAPPVTVVDGLVVGIAVVAVAIAAETEPGGDEDIVDTRFIAPPELSTFVVAFNSLIVPYVHEHSLSPLRGSHINRLRRDPTAQARGRVSAHRIPKLLFNLDRF